MSLLEPNWNQVKPTRQHVQAMCSEVVLKPMEVTSIAIISTLDRLRVGHSNGGVLLKAVRVADHPVFDWFGSRNRLLEYELLPLLLRRTEIEKQLPELALPADSRSLTSPDACTITASGGFKFDNPFLLDGQLAQRLHAGGAYPAPTKLEGRTAKQLATDFCEAMFGQRYEEVSLYSSYEAWTPWFGGIAWDWTAILFDRRERALWILAVTDTD